jgi:hypothetical protein
LMSYCSSTFGPLRSDGIGDRGAQLVIPEQVLVHRPDLQTGQGSSRLLLHDGADYAHCGSPITFGVGDSLSPRASVVNWHLVAAPA